MYVARTNTKCSLNEIGMEIGRDHSNIIYGSNKIKNWLEIPAYERELKPVIDGILEIL